MFEKVLFICLPCYIGENLLQIIFYYIPVKLEVCKYITFVKKLRKKSLRGERLTIKRIDVVGFSKLFSDVTYNIYHSKCGLQMMNKYQFCA